MIKIVFKNLSKALQSVRNTYLRLAGISIGKDTFISWGAKLDISGKGKITIGERCEITHGCVIVSHDAAVKRIDPKGQRWGSVKIGNNVFIGVNSVVLFDVAIGDNSVIGAGSVVTKDIPSNVVAVGNPAKVIKTLS